MCSRIFGKPSGTWTSECHRRPQVFVTFFVPIYSTKAVHNTEGHSVFGKKKRVAMTLYKLASNTEFHDVASLFGIGVNTASDVFFVRVSANWKEGLLRCQNLKKMSSPWSQDLKRSQCFSVSHVFWGPGWNTHSYLSTMQLSTERGGTVCYYRVWLITSTCSWILMLAGLGSDITLLYFRSQNCMQSWKMAPDFHHWPEIYNVLTYLCRWWLTLPTTRNVMKPFPERVARGSQLLWTMNVSAEQGFM